MDSRINPPKTRDSLPVAAGTRKPRTSGNAGSNGRRTLLEAEDDGRGPEARPQSVGGIGDARGVSWVAVRAFSWSHDVAPVRALDARRRAAFLRQWRSTEGIDIRRARNERPFAGDSSCTAFAKRITLIGSLHGLQGQRPRIAAWPLVFGARGET